MASVTTVTRVLGPDNSIEVKQLESLFAWLETEVDESHFSPSLSFRLVLRIYCEANESEQPTW
jgi:hypothetical protein